MSSDEYYGATEGRTGKVTGKTAAPYDPPHGDSMVQPISKARKRPTIGQTQKLLLTALRLWELKMAFADRLSLRSVFHTRRFSNALTFVCPTVCKNGQSESRFPNKAFIKYNLASQRERDRP